MADDSVKLVFSADASQMAENVGSAMQDVSVALDSAKEKVTDLSKAFGDLGAAHMCLKDMLRTISADKRATPGFSDDLLGSMAAPGIGMNVDALVKRALSRFGGVSAQTPAPQNSPSSSSADNGGPGKGDAKPESPAPKDGGKPEPGKNLGDVASAPENGGSGKGDAKPENPPAKEEDKPEPEKTPRDELRDALRGSANSSDASKGGGKDKASGFSEDLKAVFGGMEDSLKEVYKAYQDGGAGFQAAVKNLRSKVGQNLRDVVGKKIRNRADDEFATIGGAMLERGTYFDSLFRRDGSFFYKGGNFEKPGYGAAEGEVLDNNINDPSKIAAAFCEIDAGFSKEIESLGKQYKDAADKAASFGASERETLDMQRRYENDKYALEKSSLSRKMDLLSMFPNDYASVRGSLQTADKKLDVDHDNSSKSLDKKITAFDIEPVKRFLATSKSAFGQFVGDVMNKTKTLKQGLQQMWRQMAQSFVQEFVVKKAMAVLSENAKELASHSAFLSQLFGLQQAASAKTVATKTTEAAQVGQANGMEAGTGALAALSSIPYVGPILAIAAMGTIMSAVSRIMGGSKSAAGGYDIPAGVNPLTQLHAQEMVLPAEHANTIRSLKGGGGAGGGMTVHLNVSAVDGASVKRLLIENKHHVAAAVGDAVRSGWRPSGPGIRGKMS